MIRKNIYKWHRWVSILIAIPVIMWTVSGIMHPIMTSFKPKVKNQFIKPGTIDLSLITMPLKDALEMNEVSSISNFRIVKLKDSLYYQVKSKASNSLIYLNTQNGKILPAGDRQYAEQLACKFLGDSSKVLNIEFVEHFNKEYVYVNRLLPVYKITFNREDSIRVYVETFGDRMALAMDDNRYAFNRFFVSFHSWGFLDDLGNARLFVMVMLCSLAFFTSIMGIYIWFLIRRKNRSNKTKYRRWHGQVAIFASLTTLMFTFSGAFHAFKKFTPDNRLNYFYEPEIAASSLQPDLNKIVTLIPKDSIVNLSVIKMNESVYWQVIEKKGKGLSKSYVDAGKYTIFKNGEESYASFLANQFSGNKSGEISKQETIDKFTSEYGFVNKRLPVIKIQYSKNDNERYYVETSSGKLAAKIQDKDLTEGFSFAFLHKFHFMEFAGKTGRDAATVIAATATLLVTILGITLFISFMVRKRKNL